MDRRALMMALVAVLAIGGSITYLLATNSDKSAKHEIMSPAAGPSTDSQSSSSIQPSSQMGSYVEYSADVVTQTTGTKILFFHAAWCPQCRELEADIKQKGLPANVTIIKIDYDNSQSLRQKYGVTLQTTMVLVDDNGNLVKKFVAYDEPSLEAVKRNLL